MRPISLLRQPRLRPKLSNGCRVMDAHLGGGFPCASITEIIGENGSGKTQLCLQLAIIAQLPPTLGGLRASTLFLYSEFAFPSTRLTQISEGYMTNNRNMFSPQYDPLDYIYIHPIHKAYNLLDQIPKIESFIGDAKSRLPLKVIIMDSIAALFRAEFNNTLVDLKHRSSMFFNIAGKLKSLASKFELVVVITNQVSNLVSPVEGSNELRVGNLSCSYTSSRQVCAALGLAWANCVNSRLFLSKEHEFVGEKSPMVDEDDCTSTNNVRTIRQLHVIYSPHLPYSSCQFMIGRQGVRGIEAQDR